jgi:hypothetical protein
MLSLRLLLVFYSLQQSFPFLLKPLLSPKLLLSSLKVPKQKRSHVLFSETGQSEDPYERTRFQKGTLLVPKDFLKLSPTSSAPPEDKPLTYLFHYFDDYNSRQTLTDLNNPDDTSTVVAYLDIFRVNEGAAKFTLSFSDWLTEASEFCVPFTAFMKEMLKYRQLCSPHQFKSIAYYLPVKENLNKIEQVITKYDSLSNFNRFFLEDKNHLVNWITEENETVLLRIPQSWAKQYSLLHKEAKILLIDASKEEVLIHSNSNSDNDLGMFHSDVQRSPETTSDQTVLRILRERYNLSLSQSLDDSFILQPCPLEMFSEENNENIDDTKCGSPTKKRKELFSQILRNTRAVPPSSSFPLGTEASSHPSVVSVAKGLRLADTLTDVYAIYLSSQQVESSNLKWNSQNNPLLEEETKKMKWMKINSLEGNLSQFKQNDVQVSDSNWKN